MVKRFTVGCRSVETSFQFQCGGQAFGPDAVVRFLAGPHMPGRVAFVRRRFAPVSLWVDDWLASRIVLSRHRVHGIN